jgi:hypothetical protein
MEIMAAITTAAPTRRTSNMRRLRKDDVFVWNREFWIVTGMPERQGDSEVRVPMRRVDGVRSRRHTFQADRRVTLV